MIRIKKPLLAPDRLLVQGAAADFQNRHDYDTNANDYINLVVEFDILPGIYGHATVKKALKDAQKDKCCFCEKEQKDEYGAVEHYRPKMGFKQEKSDPLIKPGYFWLGYTWDNLLFVCSRCNSAEFKGNRFPLKAGSIRARSHNDDLYYEKPYLINPAKTNPRRHIFFRNEFVKFRSIYGKQTINICGLDRAALNDKRRDLIDDLKYKIIIVKAAHLLNPNDVREAKDFLIKAQKSESKFSATAIDFIRDSGIVLT
jgi:hypothetical protein